MNEVTRAYTYDEIYGETGIHAAPEPSTNRAIPTEPVLRDVHEASATSTATVPELDPAAMHGWIGEVVETIAPETEASSAALLATMLASFGSAVNSAPHMRVGGALHPARVNALIVGGTSTGRKGQSWADIRAVFTHADPDWSQFRVLGGLSSGEGLIAAVRDGADEDDPGVKDKRLLAVEPEFSRVLRAASRDGNTLSEIIRDCYDTGRLRVMTRKDPLSATGAHVSILGHITPTELRRRLTETDLANGLINRFLIFLVHRSKLLPDGGNFTDADFGRLGRLGRRYLEAGRVNSRLERTPAAGVLWDLLYRVIARQSDDGAHGQVMARASANLLRLSLIYALGDGSKQIDVAHLEAAWSVLCYCDDSAALIFHSMTGNPTADRLLEGLRSRAPNGLSGTEQRDLFGRHASGPDLEFARGLLEERGLARTDKIETGGKPRIVTYLCDESDLGDQSPGRTTLWSLRSLRSQAENR